MSRPIKSTSPPGLGVRIGLQAKMTLSVVLLLAMLMVVTTYTGIKRESQGIFGQMQKDGVALAQSYALSAENAILVHAGLGRLTGEASRTGGISISQDHRSTTADHRSYRCHAHRCAGR